MTSFWTTVVILAAAVAYFTPTLVALRRRVTNQGSVFVINFFFGLTIFGWVIALAMALRTSTLPPDGKRNGIGQLGRDIIDGIRG